VPWLLISGGPRAVNLVQGGFSFLQPPVFLKHVLLLRHMGLEAVVDADGFRQRLTGQTEPVGWRFAAGAIEHAGGVAAGAAGGFAEGHLTGGNGVCGGGGIKKAES